MLRRMGSLVLTLAICLLLVASGGTLLTGRPFLATVVRSESMNPRYRRGDIVPVWNWPGEIRVGTVILFKPTGGKLAGQWVMHRVVAIDSTGAFITRGDAAVITDQQDGLATPVLRQQVGGVAVQLGSLSLKVPWVGRLALAANLSRIRLDRRIFVPVLLVLVALSVMQLAKPARRSRRRGQLDPRPVFALVGAIVTVVLVTLTLYQSLRVVLVYEVGDATGVILGQPIGIVTPGQVVTRDLATLENRGFLPMLLLVTSDDPNVTTSCRLAWMKPNSTQQVKIEVRGTVKGDYQTPVDLSVVFPLLPPALVVQLSRLGHWFAALGGCFLPGLITISIGFVHPVSRRLSARQWRGALRRLRFTA